MRSNPAERSPASAAAVPAPIAPPEDVALGLEATADRRGAFGADLQWFTTIASTNDRAMGWAELGAPEGAVVAAEAQTRGRGRHGRTWVSPPGAGIYASVVLRPEPQAAAFVTLAAGVALVEGIQAASGFSAGVKWPNDVYVATGSGPRKLAGILAEAGVSNGTVQHVVLGFGINLMGSAWPPEVAGRATSIETEVGRAVDRGLVLAECLVALRRRYDDLRRGRAGAVLDAWRARAAATFGRSVEWDGPGGPGRGVAIDIDETGALLVRTAAGATRVVAGEVRWTS